MCHLTNAVLTGTANPHERGFRLVDLALASLAVRPGTFPLLLLLLLTCLPHCPLAVGFGRSRVRIRLSCWPVTPEE